MRIWLPPLPPLVTSSVTHATTPRTYFRAGKLPPQPYPPLPSPNNSTRRPITPPYPSDRNENGDLVKS
ncbi:hypothetical protein DM02DRAFT_616736 [Periconia macrospinosa]|uniref:Uncharacterized protein n=1 Tax=Periconia macrospinosa TaxID=97972 RepID=A0A2V1DJ48_9PLEO|nr:hypothetical protein DM02DRAFT_616736 [Periconia macrospinosa]